MDTADLLTIFEKACFVRAFEAAIAAAHDTGAVPGLVHLSDGAELFEAALTATLDFKKDQITGSHRSHGLALLAGLDPLSVAREILGRKGGLSEGLGGTQHLLAPEQGFLGSNGIVGAQVPLAAGAALSAKTLKTGGIAVACFGDGAANQGAVLETMNLAVVLNLPLLFVAVNNGYGQSTPSAYASAGGGVLARARAHGLAADYVDGSKLDDALEVSRRMIRWVRDSGNPALLEAVVPRLGGHYHGDAEVYREAARPDDPLERAAGLLISAGVPQSDVDRAREKAEEVAEAAVAEASASPDESDQALRQFMESEL